MPKDCNPYIKFYIAKYIPFYTADMTCTDENLRYCEITQNRQEENFFIDTVQR